VAEQWVEALPVDEVELEDVVRFDVGERSLAIYRSPDGMFYATDGWCTHEQAHLADGLVLGSLIECPKHNGRFDYRTGEAKRTPACVNLRTYEVRVEGGVIFVKLD
jgi:3-phenylpropionate/trans-cinnamate dioxygenase ferredoxin subunit